MRARVVCLFPLLLALALATAAGQPPVAQSGRTVGTLTTNTSTVAVASTNWATASVTINGTYAGVTVNFEISDDGLTWYADSCTRSDVAVQESSEAVASNATRAWDCGIYGTTNFRVRASAYSSGTANVAIILTGVNIEPAATASAELYDSAGNGITSTGNAVDVNLKSGSAKMQDGSGNALTSTASALDVNIKSNGVANANPCMSGFATISSVAGATSGTASV